MNPHRSEPVATFLPGPVRISAGVKAAFCLPPESHRSDDFYSGFADLQKKLCRLTHSVHAELFSGSGTLANDVVAAQLSRLNEPGLILSNGEFGDRLISHSQRFGLDALSFRIPWGTAFSLVELDRFLHQNPRIRWIWAVHCETSTGILNELDGLIQLANRHHLKLCIDGISSVGSVPADFSQVYLATAVSGKALSAYPGLSVVLSNHDILPDDRLPRYLDLGFYRSENGIPFTISSNLVAAFRQALSELPKVHKQTDWVQSCSGKIRTLFADLEWEVINPKVNSSPAVVTVKVPDGLSSVVLGDELERAGCLVSYKSQYLVSRNWIQTYVTRLTTERDVAFFSDLVRNSVAVLTT